jgi:hypothetical protein
MTYQGFSVGYHADALRQRGDFRDLINAFFLTPKQKEAIITVLDFFQKYGKVDTERPLTHDVRSAKWWKNRFVSAVQFKDFFTKPSKEKKLFSYRYLWYAVDWLIDTGWITEGRRLEKGRNVKGYWLSDRNIRFYRNAISAIENFWKGQT